MTYSRNEIAGRSFAAAVGALCSAATSADRWARFQGCIELSDKQTVGIGGEYMRGSVFRILGGPEPQKTPGEIEAEAYAAALQPMIDDLAAGELVVECRAIAAGAGAQPFAFPEDAWEDGWKLIVEGKSAILVDDTGAKYKLLKLQLASDEPPRAAAEVVGALAIQAELDPKVSPPEGRKKGKPEDYDWNGVYADWFAYFDYHGTPGPIEPGSQKRALDRARDWLSKHDPAAKTLGRMPEKSTLQRHLAKAVAQYVERQTSDEVKV